jgi:hypothetical protein
MCLWFYFSFLAKLCETKKGGLSSIAHVSFDCIASALEYLDDHPLYGLWLRRPGSYMKVKT